METNTNLEKMQKIVIMETLIKFKMIETWVNIIETLICIHIIQKIKEIISEEKENKEQNEGIEEEIEEGKEERKAEDLLDKMKNLNYKGLFGSNEGSKESMSESYEILEHKYYEKMQQLVVKLKEEQTQLQFHLGSTQDAYEFKLDIDLEATQYKMPITQESLLSLNDIFTKTKRFMKGDKSKWKENVTEFINKHFMNDLVDDIVTKSHYNSSNVMSIIQDQIPQLRFLDNTNMKENFFSTIVEQEGKQYDDKTKTEFTKYYHHFFLENLNGNVKTTEGLNELKSLLKEFQKLREPELYAKEVLEKIDMTYEPNLNLMRDFVKDNMKTKFEAYVKPNVEIKEGVVELNTERVEILIQEVSNKLEEQKDNIIEDTEKINEQLVEIKKLQEVIENQKEIIENQKEDYNIQKENYNKQEEEDKDKYSKLEEAYKNEMNNELEKGSKEFQKKIEEIVQNHEGDKSEINSKLNEYLNVLETTKTELKEKEKENKILLENNEEQEKEINKFKNDIYILNNKNEELDKILKRINTEMSDISNKIRLSTKETIEMATEENESLKKENDRNLKVLAEELEKEKDKSADSLNKAVAEMTTNLLKSENMNEELRKQLIDDLVKLKAESLSLRNEKESILKQINEYRKEVDNTFNTFSTQISKSQLDLDKKEQQIQQLSSVIENLQNQNKELSAKEGELEKKINTKTEEKENLETQLTSTQEELETYKRKNTELKQQIDFLKKQQEDLENKQTELQNQYKEQSNMLNEDLNGKDITIDDLRKQLQAKNKEIADNKAQIESKNKEIVAKEAKLREDEVTMTNLSEKIGNQEQEISELEELIAKLTSEKKKVEAELNSIRAKEEKEKERIRQEEEAQKQKEEEERIRKAEEKKSKETDKRRKKEEELKRLHELVLNKEKIDALDSIINLEKNIKALLEFDTSKLTIINVTREVSYLKDKQNYKKLIEFINKMRNIIKGNEIITQDILETADTYYGFEEDTKTPSTYLIQNNKQFQFKILNDIWSNIHERIEYVSKNISKNGSNSSFLEIIINLKENFNNMNSTVLDYLQRSVAINNPEENAGLKYNKKSPIIVLSTEEIKNPNQIEPNSQNITKENIIELINLNQNQYLFDKKMYKNGNGYEFKPNNFNKFITDIINQYANNNKCLNPKQNSKKEDKEKQALELIIESRRDTRNKKNSCSKSDEINEIVKHFNSIFYTNRNNWLQSNNQEIPDTVSYDKKTPQAKNNQNASTELVSMSNTGVTDIKPNNLNNDLAKENYMTPEKTQQNGGKKKTRRKGRTKKKTKTRKK
jgi:epidermal growth factor receptor substrate 15